MVLTREFIGSGGFLAAFDDLPGQPRWTRTRITASMHAALAQRPAGQPVWLFAYGSLIWNPVLHFEQRQAARLDGWQRRFCLKLLAGRGSPQTPGRMLALDAGGQCAGVALRLAERSLHEELMLVWLREMIYGSYRPIWVPLHLDSGQGVAALTFVANPALPQYIADTHIEATAREIATATGALGSNLEYLLRLQQALLEHGIDDARIRQLAAAATGS